MSTSHHGTRYSAARPCTAASGFQRPERVDEAAARMLGVGADRAKRLRLSLIAEAITAILTATRDHPEMRETFRRAVLEAASGSVQPALSPTLILAAQDADCEEDRAEVRYHLDPTPANRAALMRAARLELALATDRLNALEGA